MQVLWRNDFQALKKQVLLFLSPCLPYIYLEFPLLSAAKCREIVTADLVKAGFVLGLGAKQDRLPWLQMAKRVLQENALHISILSNFILLEGPAFSHSNGHLSNWVSIELILPTPFQEDSPPLPQRLKGCCISHTGERGRTWVVVLKTLPSGHSPKGFVYLNTTLSIYLFIYVLCLLSF